MAAAFCDPLRSEGAEVLDVVRDHRPTFVARHIEEDPVAASCEIVAFRYGVYVIASVMRPDCDLTR
jgi:hypothetical protein